MAAMQRESHGGAASADGGDSTLGADRAEAAWEADGSGEVAPPSGAQAVPASLLRGLNPEQLAAVTLPARPALILAGAGSGKTRVLTTRIAWLLQTGQVSPAGVMAVTFTNKAAKEMLTRLSAMLPVNVRGMWIGTFHGLCNRFLRAHWKLAGLPQSFQILDAQDSLSAVKRVIKALQLDEQRFVPKQVSWFIAGSKEDGLRPRDIELRDEHTRKLVEIYQAYEDQCQREGVVDFAELMLRSYGVSTTGDASTTCWWTSSRTPTACSTAGCRCSPRPARARVCSPWAMTTRAFTPSAVRGWATWPTSSASTAFKKSSSSSATTARPDTSWTPRMS
jgi:hypothetical protein